MLLNRNDSAEIMDDFSIKDERIDAALYELKKINKYLGGEKTSKAGLINILAKLDSEDVRILDVGSGASSVSLTMKDLKTNLEIYSIDKNFRACQYLKNNSTEIKVICADIFFLPFKKKCFDIIHSSLLFHHFNEQQIKVALNYCKRITKHAVIINDLRRNILAFIGIKLLTLFFSKSEMVKNDAPVSVMRGFIKREILKMFGKSGFEKYKIKRMWAFRWLIIIYMNDNEF